MKKSNFFIFILGIFFVFSVINVFSMSCSGRCESGKECNAAGNPSEGKMWSCWNNKCVEDDINSGGNRCYFDCQLGWQPCDCDVSGCIANCLRENAGKPGHHTRTELCDNCGQKFTCGCDIPEQPYCGDSKCNDGSSKTCEPNGNTKDMKCVNNVYSGDLTNGVCRTAGTYACTYCGDKVLQTGAGEECDDGNNVNGDGCDANCKTEIILPYCGDSKCNDGSSKTCEPNGNTKDMKCQNDVFVGDLPDSVCRTEEFGLDACTYCGDGIVQEAAGEECDDGNNIDDDECTNACTFYIVPEFSTLTIGLAIFLAGIGIISLRKK